MIVSFQNDGYIDPVSITTFGVNAKDSDNPIGYFGTGLKYALAIILRAGGEITIRSGEDCNVFDVQKNTVRGKSFEVIRMNGQPLGFTTELGKNWEMWQAFRELYCNAIDEGGYVFEGEVEHFSDNTTVTVRCPALYEAYLNRGDIILGSDRIAVSGKVEVHPGGRNAVFFKRVRIHQTQLPSIFTYNICTGLDITEDRTAKYSWQVDYAIERAIAESRDARVIESAILAPRDTYEGQLGYEASMTPTSEFLDAVERLRKHPDLNPGTLNALRKYRKLPPPRQVELNNIQRQQLDKAIVFSKAIGYEVDKYPIVVTDGLSSGIMGQADAGVIFVSVRAFGNGTKYVAATLIEEYLHLSTGYADETRELQDHLFHDIVSLGEQLYGQPV